MDIHLDDRLRLKTIQEAWNKVTELVKLKEEFLVAVNPEGDANSKESLMVKMLQLKAQNVNDVIEKAVGTKTGLSPESTRKKLKTQEKIFFLRIHKT